MVHPYLIAVDGPLGSGKTTFCRLLTQSLADLGHAAVHTTALSETPLGSAIRSLQFEVTGWPLALAAAADRLLQFARIARPVLDEEGFVVADRFLLTAVALDGFAGGCGPHEILNLYRDLPIPAATYFIETPTPARHATLARKGLLDRYADSRFPLETEVLHYRTAAAFLIRAKWNIISISLEPDLARQVQNLALDIVARR